MKIQGKTIPIVSVFLLVLFCSVAFYTYLQQKPDTAAAKTMKTMFCEPSPTWDYPPRPPARAIVFPENKTVGILYTTTNGIGYTSGVNMDFLGPAKGEIILPGDAAVQLEVKEGERDFLANLDSKSIQVLDFSAPIEKPFELYTPNQTKRVVQLSDEDLQPITKMDALYRLVLHNTTITDQALVYISEVKSLRSINLFNTKITDNGLQLLTKLPLLMGLDLGATNISDEGLKHLGNCAKLQYLNLTGSRRIKGNQTGGGSYVNLNITDRGIAHLHSLQSLTSLDISDTNVTDQSIDVLSKLTSLSYLNVSGSLISKKGIQRFKKILPACQVVDDPGISNR